MVRFAPRESGPMYGISVRSSALSQEHAYLSWYHCGGESRSCTNSSPTCHENNPSRSGWPVSLGDCAQQGSIIPVSIDTRDALVRLAFNLRDSSASWRIAAGQLRRSLFPSPSPRTFTENDGNRVGRYQRARHGRDPRNLAL